jgi:hypothetical protein
MTESRITRTSAIVVLDPPPAISARALFLRVIQHLLPDAAAWRIVTQKVLRKFFSGLAAGVPSDAKIFIDNVYADLRPLTTEALASWEDQFGYEAASSDPERRSQLASAWLAQGGQSPRYMQEDVLQAAGFDVYVHDWWDPPGTAPRSVRDPRAYTNVPLIGTMQCGEDWAQCDEFEAQCDEFLANDPKYLVNENLTPVAPPLIPSDPLRWRHFIYIGGATFPDLATIPSGRRTEFERLVLKYRPTNKWVVLLIS